MKGITHSKQSSKPTLKTIKTHRKKLSKVRRRKKSVPSLHVFNNNPSTSNLFNKLEITPPKRIKSAKHTFEQPEKLVSQKKQKKIKAFKMMPGYVYS